MMYQIFRFLLRAMYRLLFRLEARGVENVPVEGPVIIASNHLSNFDPPTVGVLLKRKVRFMAKEELFKVPVLGPLINSFGAFPVRRDGIGKDAIKTALNLVKSGEMLGIFPEGTRNNDSGMAKKGAALIAVRSGAVIIPTAIVGEYKLFRKTYVYYGKPLDLQAVVDQAGDQDKLEAVTEAIMRRIHMLIEQHHSS
ncbi:lysophospholipid acyltransferase family protein [Paenibacillus yanchengensis]|uniref:Lysophospholipid acyltransferase family protein n=1 Tax=Paenibacillus yanchengensis TaxID=2035833 RepID=A0ABW4YJX1_9BACL